MIVSKSHANTSLGNVLDIIRRKQFSGNVIENVAKVKTYRRRPALLALAGLQPVRLYPVLVRLGLPPGPAWLGPAWLGPALSRAHPAQPRRRASAPPALSPEPAPPRADSQCYESHPLEEIETRIADCFMTSFQSITITEHSG